VAVSPRELSTLSETIFKVAFLDKSSEENYNKHQFEIVSENTKREFKSMHIIDNKTNIPNILPHIPVTEC